MVLNTATRNQITTLSTISEDVGREIISFLDVSDKIIYITQTGSNNFTRNLFFVYLIQSVIEDFFRDLKEKKLNYLFEKAAVCLGSRTIICDDVDNFYKLWGTYALAYENIERTLTKTIDNFFKDDEKAKEMFMTQVKIVFDKESKLCLKDFKDPYSAKKLVLLLPDHYVWEEDAYDCPMGSAVGLQNRQSICDYIEIYRETRMEEMGSDYESDNDTWDNFLRDGF